MQTERIPLSAACERARVRYSVGRDAFLVGQLRGGRDESNRILIDVSSLEEFIRSRVSRATVAA